jgi:hypothetical protein
MIHDETFKGEAGPAFPNIFKLEKWKNVYVVYNLFHKNLYVEYLIK